MDKETAKKALELQEREAVIITRERTLERTIRDVLRREQAVAAKEERIEAFMRQLQGMGVGDLALALEAAFRDALKDLREASEELPSLPESASHLTDGGSFAASAAGAPALPGVGRPRPASIVEELDGLTGLTPEGRSRRYLERLDRELGDREHGEVWDRADRMRYLARTFEESANHDKATEFARRALLLLDHFKE